MRDRNIVRCFSKRLLSPFHGTLQVVAVDHGEAESSDGINWVLYVRHESIVSHTGMSEVRYGSWSRTGKLKLSIVRGTEINSVIDEVGEQLVSALEENAENVPFDPRDYYECWLMSQDDEPLALIDSVTDTNERQTHETPLWHPGAAAYVDLHSDYGDAARLRSIVNDRAGRRSRSIWVYRPEWGDAYTDENELISADRFPPFLLRDEWRNNEDASLVRDYLCWQAPWLLQLHALNKNMRIEYEKQAWKRPLLCAKQYRLFVDLQDEKGLTVVRVQARLMGDDAKGQELREAFIHTGDKESYSP